jgi:voltage-gated potassium channel Kch
VLPLLLLLLVQAPQNPSPMSDSTRPHPRVAQYLPEGRRATLSQGTLYLPPTFTPRGRHVLVVHFHGAPWLMEHHVKTYLPQAALVSVQLGSGSRVYAEAFAQEGGLTALVEEAKVQAGALLGAEVRFDQVVLTAFSAGYGAVRSILQHPEQYASVAAVLLADGLHASYSGDATGPRTADLPVDESSLTPFIAFARDAAAGRKRMLVTHSEVFPGTFASTTETADVLLRHLGLSRQRVLEDGPIGMQNLSEARQGRFELLGFAGNSAPDHLDHFYALGEFLRQVTR